MSGLTRTKKIVKLEHAIREYRGLLNKETGKWVHPPKLKAKTRVIRWLNELGIDTKKNIEAIQGFKSLDEMRAWIKSLSAENSEVK